MPAPAPLPSDDDLATPLVVDLDGTLILTDMLHESAIKRFRADPLAALRWPFWLARGKAFLKQELTRGIAFDVAVLPYNEPLLAWLREQRAAGRHLVLCTASDQTWAKAIAGHLGLFDEVIASDGQRNLKAQAKAQALVERFGVRGFDYAGNAHADMAVWQQARRAVVVNAPAGVVRQANAQFDVDQVFPAAPGGLKIWGRALRVHHWIKNVLLFVPILAGHHWFDWHAWGYLLWSFLAFSLCASAVYLANDLMDLESDRHHPRKRRRPLAAGALPVLTGALVAPLLVVASYAIAAWIGPAFLGWLTVYFLVTCAYSLGLKRLVLIDCLTLATLYTLRVVAGSVAPGLSLSFWLLAFSGSLFLSLAFLKRYAELLVQQAAGKTKAHGRGYHVEDAPVLQILGVGAGYMAVVVLALYLNSEAVRKLYASPGVIGLAVPVMVYWISWLWLRAARGEMHDDPLVFAFKDRASLLAGLLFAAAMLVGTIAW